MNPHFLFEASKRKRPFTVKRKDAVPQIRHPLDASLLEYGSVPNQCGFRFRLVPAALHLLPCGSASPHLAAWVLAWAVDVHPLPLPTAPSAPLGAAGAVWGKAVFMPEQRQRKEKEPVSSTAATTVRIPGCGSTLFQKPCPAQPAESCPASVSASIQDRQRIPAGGLCRCGIAAFLFTGHRGFLFAR